MPRLTTVNYICPEQIDCNKNVGVLHFRGDCIFSDSLNFSFLFPLTRTGACCEKVKFNNSHSGFLATSESKFKFKYHLKYKSMNLKKDLIPTKEKELKVNFRFVKFATSNRIVLLRKNSFLSDTNELLILVDDLFQEMSLVTCLPSSLLIMTVVEGL